MKRRLRTLLVFLLLLLVWGAGGAIVNIVVAWVCGCFSEPRQQDMRWGTSLRDTPPTFVDVHCWRVHGFGFDVVSIFKFSGFEPGLHYEPLRDVFPDWLELSDLAWAGHDATTFDGVAFAQGWPMLSMWCDRATPQAIQGGLMIGSRPIPLSFLTMDRILAFRPLWPGFAINTVFYAGVLWLLFAAPFALRRRRRIKRGLCPKCAYPVGASEICTECGEAVQRMASTM